MFGDWDGILADYDLNASSSQFILGFDPFKVTVIIYNLGEETQQF